MKITLKHDSGITKEVKKGFSWTVFFFGAFVPLVRGDIKWAAIMFLLAAGIGAFTFGIGATIVGIVFSFMYNKIYTKELVEKGYKPVDGFAHQTLQEYGIHVAPPAQAYHQQAPHQQPGAAAPNANEA